MMCIVWAVLALGLLGLSIITWVAFRILALSREFDSVDGFEERRGRGCADGD